MRSKWQIDRRTFLRGAGVACALPWLEAMAPLKAARAANGDIPKRLAFIYVPNGVGLPEDPAYKQWRWFPEGEGADYKLTNVLSSLEPFREDMSIIGGLSHPKSRHLLGHLAGDTWLTGGDLRGSKYLNTISLDQVAARAFGTKTRYPSLTLSTDGGVGYKSRVSTLSFDDNGRPMPSEHRQRAIFERYFAPGGGAATGERRKSLAMDRKIVDLVLEDSKSLKGKLGQSDKAKLDEYLDSLNATEKQIRRNEEWLDIPMKDFDASSIQMDMIANVDPAGYLRSMLDLMVLAFETDLTHVQTFMMAREDGMGFGDLFPKLALGINKGHHTISHDKATGHWEEWGRHDQWLAEQFAYFLGRMKNVRDEHGPLLDNTLVLYGSACSTTHNANNYPLVLAGGKNMGAQHGKYTVHDPEHAPLSNLFVSMLNAAGVQTDSFSDSTGPIDGHFA